MNNNQLINEIRSIRSLSNNFKKKRKHESDRDYVFRIAGYRCEYCRNKFPKSKLSLVKKFPDKTFISNLKNGICACRECANKKGNMTDKEFKRFISKKKKDMRKEVFENYHKIRKEVFEKYDYKCIYCVAEHGNTIKGRKLTIDHKVPIAKGGTNDLNNLCCSCEEHNFDKGDLTAEDYLQEIQSKKSSGSFILS